MRPPSPGRTVSVSAACAALACAALLGTSLAQGGLRVLGPGDAADPPGIEVLRSTAEGMDLEFTLPALVAQEATIGGETFQEVGIPGGAAFGEVGSPMLPGVSRLVAVPPGAGVQVSCSVEEEEDLPGFHLYPVQGAEGDPFVIDRAAYARSGFGDAPAARAGAPGSIRGLRVVPLTFAPVRYDPSTGILRVARRLHVEVTFSGGTGRFESPATVTPSFDRIYRSLLLNYDRAGGDEKEVREGTWLLILPDVPEVLSRLQPLIDWRTRQGYHVRVATTSETGTSAAQIKAFIQDGYDHWPYPPEYIVLAGDASGSYSLPTWYESVSGLHGEGDHPYTQLDGTDILADAHVGRLSFSSLDELSTIVAKIVNYESQPYTADTDWFTRACLVGDPYDSGYSTVQVQQWIKTRLREIGYTQIDTIFSGSFPTQMRNALNRGDTIFCYRGIGGFSGWSNSQTYALTNYNKLFFSVTITCGTGSFAGGTSNSEAFLRAGTADQPKAGVGAIATATQGTHTRFNNCYTYGVFQGLLYEGDHEMGAAHTRGKFELYTEYQAVDPNAVIKFSYWNNLMGDPACKVWTSAPMAMNAEYPAEIPQGTNSVRVRVTGSDNGPLAGAQVCLLKGSETVIAGRTDATGSCELPVNTPTAGTMQITVSAYNYRPILDAIPVTSPAVFVASVSSTVDDDQSGGSQGNGDGSINPGETIELGVRLHNFGSQVAPQVRAEIGSADPYLTLLDATQDYGDIPPGGESDGPGVFRFTVSRAAPDGHTFRLGLDASSGSDQWHSLLTLPVASADLHAVGNNLYPPGVLDPGETLQMSVILRNDGSVPAAASSAVLRSMTPLVWVPDSLASFGTIPVGGTGEDLSDRFSIQADRSVFPGTAATLRLVTSFNGGSLDTTYTTVSVGSRVSGDPIGPDGHGYWAFDDTDARYSQRPWYTWVEVAPNYGGDGTQVPLGDYADYQDKSTAMDLPFTFRFYGQDFDRVTICSNGWLAMGDTYLTDYRNWSIPGAGAPRNLIAVFWDDLQEISSTGGHVYQKYDAPNHRWIVEWSRMRNAVGYVPETFEAILYDPAFYPTWTGDGILVFQYNQVYNVDSVDGYATVGIQNQDHTDGLLYTYFARYPAGAATLGDGRAIRFLTAGSNPADVPDLAAAPSFSLEPCRPNPFTTGTVLGFSLPRAGAGRLVIYDASGRKVRGLLDGPLPAGAGRLRWDGRDEAGDVLPSGIYFYRLEAAGREAAGKVIKIE